MVVRAPPLLVVLVLVGGAARADVEQQPTQAPEAPPPKQPTLTRAPELIEEVAPIYPPAAKSEGRTGEVVLLLTIDAAGAVTEATVRVSSGSPDLDEAAVTAARAFKFQPAEFDGVPGAVAIEFKTTFALEQQIVEVPIEAPADDTLPPMAGDPGVAAGPIAIDGLVRAAVTKLPIADVEVVLQLAAGGEERSATTDAEGRFRFRAAPPGSHRLTLAASGFVTSFVDVVIEEKQRTDVIAYLEPTDSNAFETIVRERRAKAEVTRVALTREEVKSVPGTFGDPLRVIENLPGLARAPFAGGALIIRGANPADSSVLFDGIPIPQLYHFQGLKSIVNAEFLDDISFYPGGFPVRYGRATAGVVDVSSRKLVPDAMRGAVDVNLMDASFFLTIPLEPLGVPNTTIAMAARRSYIDAILPIVLDVVTPPGGQSIVLSPVYWDYQLKLQTKLLGTDASLFIFGSDDDVRVSAVGTGNDTEFGIGIHTAFHRIAGRSTVRISDTLTNIAQPFVGVTTQGASIGAGEIGVEFGGDTYNWGVRDELRAQLLDNVRVSIGLDYLGEIADQSLDIPATAFQFDVGGFPRIVAREIADPDEETENTTIESSIMRNAVALWIESEIDVIPSLKVVPGVRGEWVRTSYAPQVLDDGTTNRGGEVDQWTVDPRVAVRYELLPDLTTMTGSAGLFHQPATTQDLSPTGGNDELLPPGAVQLIGGVEQGLTDDISINLQGYVTSRFDLVQRVVTASNLPNAGGGGPGGGAGGGAGGGNNVGGGVGAAVSGQTTLDNGGDGLTYGVELLLRHDISRWFYGWVAYTLSRSEIDIDPDSEEGELTSFDQTHILTLVGQARLPWGFSLGARFRYVTGNPTSLPIGSFHDLDNGNYAGLTSSPGSARQPDFHQLDVRLDKKWTFDNLSLTTYLDLLNAYNAQNVEATLTDFRSVETQGITGLPILPVFGVSGEF